MNNKYIFSALAATAVIVAPIAVEQAEAASNQIDLGKALRDDSNYSLYGVRDLAGNQLKAVDEKKKIYAVTKANLNKIYYYNTAEPEGYSGGIFYLTGTVEKPIVLRDYYVENDTQGVLYGDKTLKVVKHSFKKSTPIVHDGSVLLAFEKAGDTIQLSNGAVLTVVKASWGGYVLKASKLPKVVSLELNGEPLYLSAAESPYLANGTTMVPLRVISEALGAKVNYNANKSISLVVGTKQITLNNNSKTAYVKNGAALTMSAPVTIKNGRTYVPLRFISESFGAKVNWEQANYKVTITK